MSDSIETLLEELRSIPGWDPERHRKLVDAIRLATANRVAELIGSPDPILQLAALEAAEGREDPAIVSALPELVESRDPRIRAQLARWIAAASRDLLTDVVGRLLGDDEAAVRDAAVGAARARRSFGKRLGTLLAEDSSWNVRASAARALREYPPETTLCSLLEVLPVEEDRDVFSEAALSADLHLERLGDALTDLDVPDPSVLEAAHESLRRFGGARFARLRQWLDTRLREDVNLEKLRSLGTDLTAEAEQHVLPRAYGVEQAIDAVSSALLGPNRRSVVLVGRPGSGKTALVQELTYRLLDPRGEGWRVLRVSAGDLLAGTKYLGELQTRVRNLVDAARSPKRVILYVPNIEELACAGRTSSADVNVASQLAPYIDDGSLLVLGETTPEAFQHGVGARPALRRLFQLVEVKEASRAHSRWVLRRVCDASGVTVSDDVLDRLVELTDEYLTGTVQPGRAVGMLHRVLEGKRSSDAQKTSIAVRDVLSVLSLSTGVPVELLDDERTLDLRDVRSFFEARVMGQPEALDAVVDLVTLVKAGLTDPHKPLGVLLFLGPTGVGKTELARSLAEFIFGDPGKILRLDMSEFATYEAYERLIGREDRPGLLTEAVHQKPFSVVLLDEIEKAHGNVFDLCLQVFDAGRLMDGRGRSIDFRRAIIVLTSNVGAPQAMEAPIGFATEQEAHPAPAPSAGLKELAHVFRPEFLNRIDRIITFRPLTPDTAERIARREVHRVLTRSGLTRRNLAVDLDPDVLSLLVKEGYSRVFGARPLKRTVERFVLLPVARAIASGSAPDGAVLQLHCRERRVEVEVVPSGTTADEQPPGEIPEGLRALRDGVEHLLGRLDDVTRDSKPLADRKTELLTRTAADRFWKDREEAERVLDEVHRLDGVLSLLRSTRAATRNLSEAIAGDLRGRGDARDLRVRLDALRGETERLEYLVNCRDADGLGDAFVWVYLVNSRGAGLGGVERLSRMYRGFGVRRRFEVEVVSDRVGGDPPEDSIILLVSGGGAFGLLHAEAGLHQLVRRERGAMEERDGRTDRDVVRVEVLPVPRARARFGRDEVRVRVEPLAKASGRLLPRREIAVQLFHEDSLTSVEGWTAPPRREALTKMHLFLRARVEARSQDAGGVYSGPLVRRYTVGPAAKVLDLRTGRSSTRLDRVLGGELDGFLVLPVEK